MAVVQLTLPGAALKAEPEQAQDPDPEQPEAAEEFVQEVSRRGRHQQGTRVQSMACAITCFTSRAYKPLARDEAAVGPAVRCSRRATLEAQLNSHVPNASSHLKGWRRLERS